MKTILASSLFLIALSPTVVIGEEPPGGSFDGKQTGGDARARDDAATEGRHPFTVRVVDPEANPVADAHVGRAAGRMAESGPEWHFWGINTQSTSNGERRTELKPAVTNVEGETQMFLDDMPKTKPNLAIVARQAPRGLVGAKTISRQELLSASKDKLPITIPLSPECRVRGQIRSTGLEKLGQQLSHYAANVELDGNQIFTFYSERPEFEFFLPPGTYSIASHGGNDALFLRKVVTVPAATTDVELEALDLPPANMAKLIGQQAPEIAEIVAWKNSEPLKLADLHGKYVLLEFWGYWCGPCIHHMPRLFALHDEFAKRGLVIIGVHVGLDDETIESVEAIDAKLAGIRQEVWGGRDVPFPVAMVASRRMKHIGAEQTGASQTSVDYGVQWYPSGVLIDPEGKVVGWFDEEKHVKLFEELPKAD